MTNSKTYHRNYYLKNLEKIQANNRERYKKKKRKREISEYEEDHLLKDSFIYNAF